VADGAPDTYRSYVPASISSQLPSMAGNADIDQWVKLLDPRTPLGARLIGYQEVKRRGWTPEDWRSLEAMWNSESFDPNLRTGWSYTAGPDRPGRTALGVGQMLGKWHGPTAGVWPASHPYRKNPRVQIQMGLDYIESRYGNPSAAWEQWKAKPSARFDEDWNRWIGGWY